MQYMMQQLPAMNVQNMNIQLDTWIPAIIQRWSLSKQCVETKKRDIIVRIGHRTFSNGDLYSEGTFRRAYRMEIRGSEKKYVLKIMKDVRTGMDKVYDSVRILHEAQRFADEFNKLSPKSIQFVSPTVLLFPHLGHVPASVEPYLSGAYVKHTNNDNYVDVDQFNQPKHYTPHAFSHYCYEMTSGRKMVVDLQGVHDLWTDPAIHTKEPDGSSGNLGEQGMKSFFRSHVCHPICESLGLRNRHSRGYRLEQDSKHTRVLEPSPRAKTPVRGSNPTQSSIPLIGSNMTQLPRISTPIRGLNVTQSVGIQRSPFEYVTSVSSYNQATGQSEEVIYAGKVRINQLRGLQVHYQGDELGAFLWLDTHQFSDSYDFHLPDGEVEYFNTPFGRCCMQTNYFKFDPSKINQTTLYDRRIKHLKKKGLM